MCLETPMECHQVLHFQINGLCLKHELNTYLYVTDSLGTAPYEVVFVFGIGILYSALWRRNCNFSVKYWCRYLSDDMIVHMCGTCDWRVRSYGVTILSETGFPLFFVWILEYSVRSAIRSGDLRLVSRFRELIKCWYRCDVVLMDC